jgi:integrase
MATIKFILRKDKVNAQGVAPVYAQYTHDEKSILIATGKKLAPKHWDAKQGKATRHDDALTFNSYFNTFAKRIIKLATQLQDQDIHPLPKRVKEAYEESLKKNLPETELVRSILFLWKEYLKARKSTIAQRTYWSESNSMEAMQEFLNEQKQEHIIPEKFTFKHLSKWQGVLSETKAPNTVAKRLKHFKAFLKYYLKLGGTIGFDIADLTYKERPGPKVSLTEQELKALQNHNLSGRQAEIRDLFVLQCNTGLRISDLKRLDKNIEGNKIKLAAQKTASEIVIPISPAIRQILERYKYKLPEVPDQKINKGIKDVLALAIPESKIQVKEGKGFKTIYKWQILTSHDAIRTFITLSSDRGMSVPSIAKITGKSVQVLLKHYLNNSQKIAEVEFERAWGVSPLKIVS